MEDAQMGFGKNSHRHNLKRAHKLNRISDSKELIDVAVEYFGGRCALSGESFTQNGNDTTISMEHLVALDLGGHHIAPNIIPDVLHYNVRKKTNNLLDYWRKEKNANGDNIYSPYRLLKLVHYILKSIQARQEYENSDNSYEQYRQTVLDEKDPVFQQIIKLEQEKPEAFFSDVVTTMDKKLTGKIKIKKVTLTSSTNHTLKDNGLSIMSIFLHDALQDRLPQDIPQDDQEALAILAPLSELYKEIQEKYFPQMDYEIKLECMARDTIFKVFKDTSLKLDDEQYSIADMVVPALIGKSQNSPNLSEAEIKEHIEKTIIDHIKKWQSLFLDKTSDDIKVYPAILYDEDVLTRFQKHSLIRKELETQGYVIDIRNIDFAIKMLEEVTLSDGTKLSEGEQNKLLQKVLSNTQLSERFFYYLSTLEDNLAQKGILDSQERYRAIIQFVLGKQDVNFSKAIQNHAGFQNMSKNSIKTQLMREAIDEVISRKIKGKTEEEWKKEYADRIGIEEKTVMVNYRNIAFAIKMLEEVTLSDGTKLSDEEQNKLLQKFLSNTRLSGKYSCYLSTLEDNLTKKGIEDAQERYRAIMLFALGKQDVMYTSAIQNDSSFQKMTKDNINTELTKKAINRDISRKPEYGKTKEEWEKEYAKRVGIEEKTVTVDCRNIAFAIRMLEEVTLSDGAKLSEEEQNKLLQRFLSNKALSGRKPCYLSTLEDNLAKKGFEDSQERYRAIIQFALGKQDVNYSEAIVNDSNFQKMTKDSINTELTREAIDEVISRKPEDDKTKEEWKKEYAKRVGIEEKTVTVDYRNIAFAIKMLEEVTLSDGAKLSEREQNKLLQKVLSNSKLSERSTK